MHVGVDGAGGDWLAGVHEAGEYSYSLFGSFGELWEELRTAEVILVDIPIGLRNDGEPRACDTEARRHVRRGVVFPTPSRPAAYEDDYGSAKAINERTTGGKSLPRQTWNICPLIREVDEFLANTAEARGTVRESHPELCLRYLNNGETVTTRLQPHKGSAVTASVVRSLPPLTRFNPTRVLL